MGALGTIQPNGDFELALTIRTFAVADGRIHLWVGGGIVWDSDPEAEIEESWVKARPLLAAVGGLRCPYDAARGRRRRARARRSGASRSSAPTTRRCCAGAPRSRRSASTAAGRSCSTAISTASASRSRALGLPAADGVEELAALVVGAAPPDHVLRLYRTEQQLVATAAEPAGRARRAARARPEAALVDTAACAARCGREVDELRARRSPPGGARPSKGADDALFVAEGIVLEARRRTSGGGAATCSRRRRPGPACCPA